MAQGASGFRASADGKRFTYLSLRVSDAIYLGNLESGAKAFDPRRLTPDGWDSWPEDWTRDSKAVLFDSIRGGLRAILKQRIDQRTPEILLSGAEYIRPAFSPNGDRLLYTTSAAADRHDLSKRLLVSMPVGGDARSVLLAGNYIFHCGSAPGARCVLSEEKGQQLVFSVLDPVQGRGAEIQRVEALAPEVKANWSLSPDGDKVAVISDPQSAGEIRVLTLADRQVVTLALQHWKWESLQSVAWSADGSHLFATAWSVTSAVLLFTDLRGNLQVLAEVPSDEAWVSSPVPSPDGRYLAYQKRTYESNVMMLEHF